MQQETGNPNFVYEIACDQMCGAGHTGMRGEIIVESQEEYDQWIRSKMPKWWSAKKAIADAAGVHNTAVAGEKAAADSTGVKKDSATKN